MPSTSDGVGISCHDMMVPAVRTRADWIVVGEVRGAEGVALVQAMSIGQGAMATVHGGSAKDGIERLAELIAYHSGTELRMARWQVYRSVDLVVHVTGDNRHGRYVTEIAAPSVEEDGARFILHRLLALAPRRADRRARPASRAAAADAGAARALRIRRSPPAGGTRRPTPIVRSRSAPRSWRRRR